MTPENSELELAREFVFETGTNLYLTGKAGTGKTTFLRELRRQSAKRMVVTAPTGVAAINCGGVTLHSFFQLPFGPFLPGGESGRQYKLSRQKINIIKNLDLLVIDEVSMVRADLLDGVDNVLRRYRRSSLPFGGVQLLLIGDLHQLPPVVTSSDHSLLSRHYDSWYFFGSSALQQTELITVELQHIYRQTDRAFVDLLNQVRENRLDERGLQTINARLRPELCAEDTADTITLCTHNDRADDINRSRLAAIPGKSRLFSAEIEGDFPEQGYPTEASLELKTGAQVMFMRNDNSIDKLYFNGKIGVISRISGDTIFVRCTDSSNEIEVEPATWENIRYELDEKTLEIKEERIGAFIQYPLKLAWAITIHKSQGLTFERAIIDAQAAFAYGQVYVALSRLTSLEGLILSTPLTTRAIKTDPAIVKFARQCRQQYPGRETLEQAKVTYQRRIILGCFDFQRLQSLAHRLATIPRAYPGLVQVHGVADLAAFAAQIEEQIGRVGDNFRRQLTGLFRDDALPTADTHIRERLAKAAVYFLDKIEENLSRPLALLEIETDNAEIAKKVKKTTQLLEEEIAAKAAGIRACGDDFSPTAYLRAISTAELQLSAARKKVAKTAITYQEADVGHPELYRQLKDWRQDKAKEENVAPFQVMHLKTLIQIAVNLPETANQILKIKGIGPRLAERYGDELLAMVTRYRQENNIEEVVLPLPQNSPVLTEESQDEPRKAQKGETFAITRSMLEEGLSIEDIMARRGLARSTIEGHLVRLLQSGRIGIEMALDDRKLRLIEEVIDGAAGAAISVLKEKLGETVSYNEIKMVLAHRDNIESP